MNLNHLLNVCAYERTFIWFPLPSSQVAVKEGAGIYLLSYHLKFKKSKQNLIFIIKMKKFMHENALRIIAIID